MSEGNYSLGYLLTKAARVAVHKYKKELLPQGISPPQAGILLVLDRQGAVSQVEIAKALYLDKANVNTMLKKIEQQKLVVVAKGSKDARQTKIALTSAGIRVVKAIKKVDIKVSQELSNYAKNSRDLQVIRQYLFNILFN